MPQDTDALLSAMREQAEAEKATVLSEAESKAAEIEARSNKEIERLEAGALRQVDGEMRAETDRILGQARMQKRCGLLDVKRSLIEEAFAAARTELDALCAGDEYVVSHDALVSEAVSAVGDDVTIEVAAQDMGRSDTYAAGLNVHQETRALGDQPGTVIVTSRDGRRKVDNSVVMRLARAEAVATQEIAAMLFGRR